MAVKIEIETDTARYVSVPKLKGNEIQAKNMLPTLSSYVRLFIGEEKYVLDILLNEWLLALSKFLRAIGTNEDMEFQEELIIAGEKFNAFIKKGRVGLLLPKTSFRSAITIWMSFTDIRSLHRELLNEFTRIAKNEVQEENSIVGLEAYKCE